MKKNIKIDPNNKKKQVFDPVRRIKKTRKGKIVNLYRSGEDEPIRTAKTDENGIFTFAKNEDLIELKKFLQNV